MRIALLLLSVTGLAALVVTALAAPEPATPKHHVVIEVTRDGADQWTGVLNNVENLRKALGADQTQVEVVAHANGLGILLAANQAMQDRMKAMADSGVIFAACQHTMKRKNVTEKDLLPFVTTVDSGVAETVRKQEAGWSYIKSGS